MRTLLVADIGGTSIKIGFVIEGEPHGYTRVFPTHHVRNIAPVASLARLIATAIDEAQLTPEMIITTVPGFLDKTAKRVIFVANIPELNGSALGDELTRAAFRSNRSVKSLMFDGRHSDGRASSTERLWSPPTEVPK